MPTPREVIAFYDRFGARQDGQGWYEDAPVTRLLPRAGLDAAEAVCEFGCGTGRLAGRLLADVLTPTASYLALDASATMVALARERLAPWGPRARVRRTDGTPRLPPGDDTAGAFDRFLCAYVLELLDESDARALLDEAARVLRPGGRLCTVTLAPGPGLLSGAVSALWRLAHRLNWRWVGNCRPLRVAPLLAPDVWRLIHAETVVARGIASEVLVAERR